MSTSIYMASKTTHAPRWQTLRAAGYNVISTWIDEAGEGETLDVPDLARRCIKEAAEADVFILFCRDTETLKGAFLEAGAALAAGKLVISVGRAANWSTTFASHPPWKEVDTINDALILVDNDWPRTFSQETTNS